MSGACAHADICNGTVKSGRYDSCFKRVLNESLFCTYRRQKKKRKVEAETHFLISLTVLTGGAP